MSPHTTKASFGDKSPQDQLARQAAPARTIPRKSPRVTHALAARHEALWVKLSALQVQVAAAAGKWPQARVAAHTAMVAEALLADGRVFLAAGDRLPMAAPDCGGLATQLGQALADMQLWEAANTTWRPDLNAFVWTVAGETPLPVQRLRPRLKTPVAPQADPRRADSIADLRVKLARRLAQFRGGRGLGVEFRPGIGVPPPSLPLAGGGANRVFGTISHTHQPDSSPFSGGGPVG